MTVKREREGINAHGLRRVPGDGFVMFQFTGFGEINKRPRARRQKRRHALVIR